MTDDRQDMQKMQRDAENRIREMQRRADRAVTGADMPPVPNFVRVDNRNSNQSNKHTQPQQKIHNEPKCDKSKTHKPVSENKGINLLKMLNLKNIKFDKDVTLIILMILLLSSNDSDELLIMALLYIML